MKKIIVLESQTYKESSISRSCDPVNHLGGYPRVQVQGGRREEGREREEVEQGRDAAL